MSKAKAWGVVVLVGVIVGSCSSIFSNDEPTVQSLPAAAPAETTAPTYNPIFPTRVEASTATPEQEGEQVTVTHVRDGDTFEISSGWAIRVLGIDSCELKGAQREGGEQAKRDAELYLNGTVTLVEEPGVDLDPYGRHLRYVKVDGEDFGVKMVEWDHTGVYDPDKNDASKEYLDLLFANDTKYSASPPSGRECGTPTPEPDIDVDVDHHDDHNNRDGSIIPACRRKWWC